jgi:uncharacterized protein YndB with AHSA1/START domain
MITESSIEIDADPATVWDVYADVERWPSWTASVTRLTALDGAAVEVGRRYRIEQPKMPKLVWVVTEVDPGRSWTWEQRSPGGVTVATHEVLAVDGGRTLVRQRLDQRGPVGALVGRLMKRLTVRYLELEGQGLKSASEARRAAEA